MPDASVCPEPMLAVGESSAGFTVRRVVPLPEIRVTAYELEHDLTGARVLHLHCADRENLFAIAFRTPPRDSTGLPHILEHSVLAGSERYPVKDAFNELLRGSLQTFINAFTYPDKTIYPVASQVKADFYNLSRVYADLVFRPRLLPETFLQEGHRLEWTATPAGGRELSISGIVYNEMKGAYSSPDSLMYKALQENLFPDTVYRFDSGGNPADIPSLTYEAFRSFHRSFYSPSNARIFLYGDIPVTDHLPFLQEILAGFPRIDIDSAIPAQGRWDRPRTVRGVFPIGRDEDPRGKANVNMAWLLTENTDAETVILLQVISGVLVGSAAGPLRKALIDSGLGQDLSPVTGFERDYRQAVFAVGLRGIDADRAEAVKSLILDTLDRIVREGVDRELIEGTLHQIEIQGREINRKNYPYGIVLMTRVFHTWMYGGDPLHSLNFPALIAMIRRRWQEDPGLFGALIRDWLLENPHRLLSVMEPDPTCLEREAAALKSELAARAAALTEADRDRIEAELTALRNFQTEPDTPESLATLPRLKRGDIDRAIEIIPTEDAAYDGVVILRHDIFANGIAYLDLAFDVAVVPEARQPFLPLLGKLVTQMGAGGRNYEEMAKLIALKTGGISSSVSAGFVRGEGGAPPEERRVWQRLVFRLKALHRRLPEAMDLLAELLSAGDLSDRRRLRDLVMEKKNRFQASIVPSGHLFARRLAGAALSLPAWRDEQWHGKSQFDFLRNIEGECDREAFAADIHELKGRIFAKAGLTVNMTADAEGLRIMSDRLPALLDRLAGGVPGVAAASPPPAPRNRGVVIPAQVAYVARALPAPSHGHDDTAALMVVSRFLSNGYLYRQIRTQGGAYGGMSSYDPQTGIFALMSYRDPHILRTLKVYDEIAAALAPENVASEDLEKAVIGVIGALDRPMDPSGKGLAALIRRLSSVTDAYRRTLREEVLDLTGEGFRKAAGRFLAASAGAGAADAVFAAADRLREANEQRPGAELHLEEIMGSGLEPYREKKG
ncbi:MAG: insulinase family protein [Pseudomonadota bacterium]|nr:insulinase family protein [Pseudomonadota bacterium]